METKTIKIFDLEKTLKANPNLYSDNIVNECIKNNYGLNKTDFDKLKLMFEKGSFWTFKEVNKLTTERVGEVFQIISIQELSIKGINKVNGFCKDTHFFGEMDLNLKSKPQEIFKRAFNIACSCGYNATENITKDNYFITLHGTQQEKFILEFDIKTEKIKRIIDRTRQQNKYYFCEEGNINLLPDYIGYNKGFY